MNSSINYISMPVLRVESDRNDDRQSKKEKERTLERQLPRMRIADKGHSEKMLANAMQSGVTKKQVPEFSTLPRPATVKNQSKLDGFNQPERILDSLSHCSISKDDLNHHPVSKDELNHRLVSNNELNRNLISTNDLNQSKEIKSAEMKEFHALEELLYHRDNRLSLLDVLAVLKNTDKYLKNNRLSEMKSQQDTADRDDLLCSLDFLGGYVSAFSEMPVIRAEIMEVIGSLRQQFTSRNVATGLGVTLQQESAVHLLGDSETMYSIQKDSSGHQKMVIEVSESPMKKDVASSLRAATQEASSKKINKPGDDSLPLSVQRSV